MGAVTQRESDAVGEHAEVVVVDKRDPKPQPQSFLMMAAKYGVGAALIFWGFPYMMTAWVGAQKQAATANAELQKESQKFMQEQMLTISEKLGGGLAQAAAGFEASANSIDDFGDKIEDLTDSNQNMATQHAELVASLKPLKSIASRLEGISEQLEPAVEAVVEEPKP